MHQSPMTVYDVSDECTLGAQGPIYIGIWRRIPTVASLRASHSHVERLLTQVGSGPLSRRLGVLAVFEQGLPGPLDRRARLEHRRLLEKYRQDLAAVGIVLAGHGVRPTVQRAAVTTLLMLMSPSHTPQSVFSSIDCAAGWIKRELPGVAVDDVLATVEVLRAASV